MKVLNVNFSIDASTGGGTAERTYQLSRFLLKKDIACSVLSLDLGEVNLSILKNLQDAKIQFLPCLLKRFFVPKFSFFEVRKIVAEVDIVHLIGHWSVLNAFVYYWAKRLKKPYVFCPAGALPVFGRSKILKKIYNVIVGNNIAKHAAAYIAVTQDEVLLFEEKGLNKNKIKLIPNGVCAEDFAVSESTHALKKFGLQNIKYILFVGRLNIIKGPDLLLEAFASLANELQDMHLVFAGPDGGMQDALVATATQFGLSHRVHFVGYIAGAEKAEIYQNALLLAIPSRQEAMSIVVLEAGVLSKPVLMTDQCGFSDVSLAGGEVVPATVAGIAQGLRVLLSEPDLLQKRGKKLNDYVSNHYSWDTQVEKIVRVYEEVLSCARPKY